MPWYKPRAVHHTPAFSCCFGDFSRSLLDGDALLVAKKSVQPIIFIALEVEGQRVLNWAMVATILLTPIGCVVYRLSLMRSTTRPRRRPILCGVFRCDWVLVAGIIGQAGWGRRFFSL